jgi:CheY-like chemotaxis protein
MNPCGENSHCILLAEDDEDDVFLLKRAFQRAQISYPVKWAPDGEEAISYLLGLGGYADRAENPWPVFMLLDLKMPRRTGFEVLSWVRHQPRFKCLPIVTFTSSRAHTDVQQAYALGTNLYLVKPAKFDELTDLVRCLTFIWLVMAEMPDVPAQV